LAVLLLPAISCRVPAPPALPPDPAPTSDLWSPPPVAGAEALPAAPRYAIDLVVDPLGAVVTGRQEVHYINAEEAVLDDLYLRLFPNTPGYGATMTVTQALLAGQPVTPVAELAGSALRLPLTPPLASGDALTLSLDFTVAVPLSDVIGYAQLSYIDGVMALANVYPLIPVYDDEGWNVELAPEYGDAVYADVAAYAVRVSAPPTMTLVASGACTAVEAGEWTCQAAPVREFALFLRADYRQLTRVVDGVAINSYYYPGHELGGQRALQVAVDALTTYSQLFGPYPYEELDVVETPTRAGGIEYPGLVVIAAQFYTAGDWLEWIVAHEVAHQWWYAVVGNDQVDEPWLDEALAQYSTLLYYEAVYGTDTAIAVLEEQFVRAHEELIARRVDMPVGLPVVAYGRELYGPVVYHKGPLYFQALRERVGDPTFFAILRAYYRRHTFRIATADSFLTTVKIVAGDAHTDLFEKWIAGVTGQ